MTVAWDNRLTRKYETGPHEDGVPAGVIKVRSRHLDRHRSGQDAYRAELESPKEVQVNAAYVPLATSM